MSRASKEDILVAGRRGLYRGAYGQGPGRSRLPPVVFDNLSTGFREAVRWGPFVHGDIRDERGAGRGHARARRQAVIHFAGLIEVGRSVARPDLFWDVNVGGTASLLAAMRDSGVGRLVFSSSAAVYGQGGRGPLETIPETAAKAPASPYGDTKLACERMIAAQCRALRPDRRGAALLQRRRRRPLGPDRRGARAGDPPDPAGHRRGAGRAASR